MDEDERREAAMAVAQPISRSSKVTQDQLQKLQELRMRRLQIKAKSKKIQKKIKGTERGPAKACEDLNTKDSQDEYAAGIQEDSSLSSPKGTSSLMTQQVKERPSVDFKKKQKLHWGLDTKERWERKANM